MKTPSLSKLLRNMPEPLKLNFDEEIEKQQEQMLRIQQGIWHGRERAVLVFEGFDAAGKGGLIRRLTEKLDPRGVRVHPIAAPSEIERGQHYLQRFWERLPERGRIAIFDRSWYGRVLVEKVEKLTPKARIERAYQEINQFERMLVDDGIPVIKIFLAISKREQLKRYEDRLADPYKQWKLTSEDFRNRSRWGAYVKATHRMFDETSTREAPWILIPGDHKPTARHLAMDEILGRLEPSGRWMRSQAARWECVSLREALKKAKKES